MYAGVYVQGRTIEELWIESEGGKLKLFAPSVDDLGIWLQVYTTDGRIAAQALDSLQA